MTKDEALRMALDELANARDHIYLLPENAQALTEKEMLDSLGKTIDACREALAQPEFTKHEVENADDWSDWVCPDPKSYLMKCCDCGLVHEAQFKVVRYKSEDEREDCDMVDDPNVQAVFRMRRSEEWTPKDTAYRPGGLAQPEQEPVAWMYQDKITHEVRFQKHMKDFVDHSKTSEVPLYSEPLANHELQCVCGAVWCGDEMVHLPNKTTPPHRNKD